MAEGYDLNELTSLNVEKFNDAGSSNLNDRTDSIDENWNIPRVPHNKDYHMFISYINDDAEQVRIIVDNLEEKGLRCCYHERDFLPGQQVIGNIHESINRSMSILVVLSERFVQSRFCKHEIEQALHARINEDYTIIPIKIDQCDIPEYLKNFTYIDATSVETTEMHTKILDAFLWNVWHRDQNVDRNGFTFEFPLTSYKAGCRWLSLQRYKLLFDDNSRSRIFRSGFEISDDVLNVIERIVSSSIYVKYKHIISIFTRLTTLVFFMACLLFVSLYITVTLYTLEPTMNQGKLSTIAGGFYCGILVIFIIWLLVISVHWFGLVGNFRLWKGMTRHLEERSIARLKWTLWKKINCRFAESKKLLLIFKDTKVFIVKFDFKPCKDLFMRRCNINTTLKKEIRPNEMPLDYVNRLFRTYIQENVEMLSTQSSSFGRHTMVNGAKCLCHLVEDSLMLEEIIV